MEKLENLAAKIRQNFSSAFTKFKNLSLKKKIVVIVIALIVIAILFKGVSDATKEPGYTLAKVEIGSVDEIVSETGNIATTNRTDIYSPSNGVITQMYVANGEGVLKNQLLFEVESSATVQEKRAAESNYLAAVSALNSARSTQDTLQADMFSKWQTFQDTATSSEFENSDGTPRYDQRAQSEFHIAEKNWLAAEKKFQDQKTAIAQAQANVSSTKLLLDATKDAKVLATAEGIVENVSVGTGSGVKINQVLAPVRPVMTIVSTSPTEVTVELGESDIVKVKPGQEVVLDVSAVDDREYQGRVVRVDSVGTDEAGVIRYSVYIEVLDADQNLRPGMSADCDIKTKSLEGVLIVPNSAVKPYQGGRAVRVVNPRTKEIEFIPVKIGVRGISHTQILSGVEEGQEVVTALSNESIERPSLF